MCMYVYVCMYVVCMYVCMYTVCMYVCILYACMYIFMYVYVCVYTYAYMHVCVYIMYVNYVYNVMLTVWHSDCVGGGSRRQTQPLSGSHTSLWLCPQSPSYADP